MKKSLKKGFTIIELLVVITIIGILATGGITVYTSQIQKARDTTRIKDIKSLQAGVEQSYQDTNRYPSSATTGAPSATAFRNAVSPYITGLFPQEARPNAVVCASNVAGTLIACDYKYNTVTTGANYELSTTFESQSNVTSMAANTKDGGNDPSKYELGSNLTLDTSTGGLAIRR